MPLNIKAASLVSLEWILLQVGIILSSGVVFGSRPMPYTQPSAYLPQVTAASIAGWEEDCANGGGDRGGFIPSGSPWTRRFASAILELQPFDVA